MALAPILIGGEWRQANATGSFQAVNPATKEKLSQEYPVSRWDDCEAALAAAAAAAAELRRTPATKIADFLDKYADRIDARSEEICELANQETALPVKPRLADGELPRTSGQLRQAAAAAREGTWCHATIDTKNGIRSYYAPLGPVVVMGPNNFPLAFGSVSGGDAAAALAAGNPIIGKAHSSHPGTTRLFAEEALAAVQETGLPAATVQMIYRINHADGERLVADRRTGACGYTGSRAGGLKLKTAADRAGKPIYLEMSSINPVVILPGALRERSDKVAEEFQGSCLMGTGQFCTNPGLVLLLADDETESFIDSVKQRFADAPAGTLLSGGVLDSLQSGVAALQNAGAELLVGGQVQDEGGFRYANTLLRVSGENFLKHADALQTEAFGNESLLVVVKDADELTQAIDQLEGNLTGCIYSHTGGEDDSLYEQVAFHLQPKVGRLLNDKMPTGVAVSPAMNHGGPFPATGHPGFTAVGIPASLLRFGMLQCYDNVRPARLPAALADKNPGKMWRYIDGDWTQRDV